MSNTAFNIALEAAVAEALVSKIKSNIARFDKKGLTPTSRKRLMGINRVYRRELDCGSNEHSRKEMLHTAVVNHRAADRRTSEARVLQGELLATCNICTLYAIGLIVAHAS